MSSLALAHEHEKQAVVGMRVVDRTGDYETKAIARREWGATVLVFFTEFGTMELRFNLEDSRTLGTVCHPPAPAPAKVPATPRKAKRATSAPFVPPAPAKRGRGRPKKAATPAPAVAVDTRTGELFSRERPYNTAEGFGVSAPTQADADREGGAA